MTTQRAVETKSSRRNGSIMVRKRVSGPPRTARQSVGDGSPLPIRRNSLGSEPRMPNRQSRHSLAISSPVLVQLPERAVRPAPSTPFRISVKAIVAYGDQVLLLRKVEGKWDLPGGRLDGEEDPVQGLERELREEIGIAADTTVLVDCAVRRRVTNMPILVVFYLCRTKIPVDDLQLSPEHNVARLFPPNEVENLKLYRCYKDAIVKVMAEHRRRGR